MRSSQTREETSANEVRDNQVTVGNEIPGANQRQGAPPDASANPRDQSRKSEEIVNYEISKTTKTEVIEGGRVNRISVAVLVDGTYGKNDKGDITYQPRSKEEIDQIAALVRTAIGFDQKRGDQVEVVNLRFAETPAIPNHRTQRLARGAATHQRRHHARHRDDGHGIAGPGRAVHGVVRPLVRRVLAPEERPLALPAASTAQLADALAAEAAKAAEPTATAKMIDIAQIQGQVHAQSVQKLGELADGNPSEAVSIIRQWMSESHAA